MGNPPENDDKNLVPDTQLSISVSPKDLDRYLNVKWKMRSCEVCGESEYWRLTAENERFSVIPNIGQGEDISIYGGKVVLTVNFACSNCGNIKMLLVNFIKKWVTDNPP